MKEKILKRETTFELTANSRGLIKISDESDPITRVTLSFGLKDADGEPFGDVMKSKNIKSATLIFYEDYEESVTVE